MMTQNDLLPADVPRDVRSGDAFGVIERLKRERAHFNCLGMSCGMILLVLLVIAAVTYYIVAR
jgi:hypothetical protein